MINNKVANIIASVLLIGSGVLIYIESNKLEEARFSQVGPGYFPSILAVVLIILSVLNIVKAVLQKESEKIVIPYQGRIWLTIGIIALFFFTWNQFSFFFIQAFLFILLLLTIYRLPLGFKFKHIAVNLAVSVVMIVAIYFVFDVLMYVNF